MEFFSLNSVDGVPSFKVNSTLQQALLVTKEKNGITTLYVAKTEVQETAVLDYLNAFRELHPDAKIQYIDKSELIPLQDKSGILGGDENKSEIQKQVIDIFRAAVQRRATDIHFILKDDFTVVKFRIDKVLTKYREYSAEEGQAHVFALYQTMCEGNSKQTFSMQSPVEANIDEKYVKELGLNGGRLASRPTDQKVVVVVRLLRKKNRAFTLQELGMSQKQIEIINRVSDIPSGVVFFSGPTNSGKSTLAQSILEGVAAANPGDHLITVEDPIENVIRGAVQTPLIVADRSQPGIMDRAFADAIANLVRMDPDQLFVGEVRETQSAVGCISAAQTGRKVWTTIHTYYPIDIIARLKALDVDADLITDSTLIVCLIGQRTTPLLCKHCKIPFSEIKDSLRETDKHLIEQYCDVNNVYLPSEKGCEECDYTGHHGMSGIFEIIETDAEFMQIYHEQGKMKAYEHWYKNGGVTLCASLLSLVNAGKVNPLYAHRSICNLDRDQRMFTQDIRDSRKEV